MFFWERSRKVWVLLNYCMSVHCSLENVWRRGMKRDIWRRWDCFMILGWSSSMEPSSWEEFWSSSIMLLEDRRELGIMFRFGLLWLFSNFFRFRWKREGFEMEVLNCFWVRVWSLLLLIEFSGMAEQYKEEGLFTEQEFRLLRV